MKMKDNKINRMNTILYRIIGECTDNDNDKKNVNLNMRDLLKITRNLNEEENKPTIDDKKTDFDQEREEKKFLNYVDGLNINVKFIELEVYDDFVFWGGTVDGIIQFIYKVTPDDRTSGVEFNYLEDFSPDNPENEEIIKKIETYYDEFYDYWSNNMLQP